jgi:hypothetical protein
LLAPGAGPPFRRDRKVKLDKSEVPRGGLSCRLRGATSALCYSGIAHPGVGSIAGAAEGLSGLVADVTIIYIFLAPH